MLNAKEIREDLFKIMEQNPESIQWYARKIGLGPQGQSLMDFMYSRRPTRFNTMLRIWSFIKEHKAMCED